MRRYRTVVSDMRIGTIGHKPTVAIGIFRHFAYRSMPAEVKEQIDRARECDISKVRQSSETTS